MLKHILLCSYLSGKHLGLDPVLVEEPPEKQLLLGDSIQINVAGLLHQNLLESGGQKVLANCLFQGVRHNRAGQPTQKNGGDEIHKGGTAVAKHRAITRWCKEKCRGNTSKHRSMLILV